MYLEVCSPISIVHENAAQVSCVSLQAAPLMGPTRYAGSVVVPKKGWVIYGFESEDSTEEDSLAPVI